MSEIPPLPTAEQHIQQLTQSLKQILNPSGPIPFGNTELVPPGPNDSAKSYSPEQIKASPKLQITIDGNPTNLPDFLRDNLTSLLPSNQLSKLVGIHNPENISLEKRLRIYQELIKQPKTIIAELTKKGINPSALDNPALVVACLQVAALDEIKEAMGRLSQKTIQEKRQPTDKRRRQIYTIIDAGLDEVTLTGQDMSVVRKKILETPDGQKIELPDIETTVREDLLAAQQLYNSLVPPKYLVEIAQLEQQIDEAQKAGDEEKGRKLSALWLQKRQTLYKAILSAFNVIPTDEKGNPNPIPFTEEEQALAKEIKQRYEEPITYTNFQGEEETRVRGSLNAIDANRLATIEILRELKVPDDILQKLANPETWHTLQMERHANPKDESFLQKILQLDPNLENYPLVRRVIIDRLNTDLRLAGVEGEIESRFKTKTGDLPQNLILPIFHNMGLKGIELLLRRSLTKTVTVEKETPVPLPEEIANAKITLLRQQQTPEAEIIEKLEQLAEAPAEETLKKAEAKEGPPTVEEVPPTTETPEQRLKRLTTFDPKVIEADERQKQKLQKQASPEIKDEEGRSLRRLQKELANAKEELASFDTTSIESLAAEIYARGIGQRSLREVGDETRKLGETRVVLQIKTPDGKIQLIDVTQELPQMEFEIKKPSGERGKVRLSPEAILYSPELAKELMEEVLARKQRETLVTTLQQAVETKKQIMAQRLTEKKLAALEEKTRLRKLVSELQDEKQRQIAQSDWEKINETLGEVDPKILQLSQTVLSELHRRGAFRRDITRFDKVAQEIASQLEQQAGWDKNAHDANIEAVKRALLFYAASTPPPDAAPQSITIKETGKPAEGPITREEGQEPPQAEAETVTSEGERPEGGPGPTGGEGPTAEPTAVLTVPVAEEAIASPEEGLTEAVTPEPAGEGPPVVAPVTQEPKEAAAILSLESLALTEEEKNILQRYFYLQEVFAALPDDNKPLKEAVEREIKNLQQQNPNLFVEETITDENGQQTIQITVKDSSIEDVRKLFKDQSQTRDFQDSSSLDTLLLTEGLTEEQEQQIRALLKSQKFNEEFERFDDETMFACANVVLRYGNDEQKQKVIEFLKRNYNIAESEEAAAPAPVPEEEAGAPVTAVVTPPMPYAEEPLVGEEVDINKLMQRLNANPAHREEVFQTFTEKEKQAVANAFFERAGRDINQVPEWARAYITQKAEAEPEEAPPEASAETPTPKGLQKLLETLSSLAGKNVGRGVSNMANALGKRFRNGQKDKNPSSFKPQRRTHTGNVI
jgi:hypothetical protein